MEKEFGKITDNIRKVLMFIASQKNPFAFLVHTWLGDLIEENEEYKKDLIVYMTKAGLLRGDPYCFFLTDSGMNLAQDISNEDIWNEAKEICSPLGLHSLNSLYFAVREITRKEICSKLK